MYRILVHTSASATDRNFPYPPGQLFKLIRKTDVAGNLTADAHIAVLSLEYHVEIHTADPDFARFPGIRWRIPLNN